jgi:hypothetical protein
VIVVAWPDGEVLWSEDRLGGGPPYSIGHVSPERVRGVLDRAQEDGALDDVTLARPCFGPDTRYTTILFKRGRRQLRMASWHELAEAAGTLVARSCALTALSGERRLEVLRREPSEALYYRVVWGELRGLAVGLIPPAGGRAAGEVLLHGGTLAWQEESR